MTTDTKRIEVTAGPMVGHMLDVASADAERAISEGWARDPFAPIVATRPPPSDEDRAKIDKLASEGTARLRGEQQPQADQKADPKPPRAAREMQADKPAGYATRSTESK